jgi:RsiW-degrading membrane proteinase PrsW (M82 family)
MVQQMWDLFASFFANPSILGIGLAVVFGAIWLVCYWPPLFRNAWLWLILVGGSILTPVAYAFVELPIRIWSGQLMIRFWSQQVTMPWFQQLAVIVQIVLSGLVQEGSKLVPVVVYWWRKGRSLDPKLGLVVGAVAGVGFGILEAQWIHNSLFAAGWGWWDVEAGGVAALVVFWDRFFMIAFHAASCALAGYGLAKGWGWQFYLLTSLLHALLYCVVFFGELELLSGVQVETFIATLAMVITGVVLWLRWSKTAAAGIRKAR